MADSPLQRCPLDPKEQPILDRILIIRDHLSLLKSDRSTYVKSADVEKYYKQLIEQVEQLNTLRVEWPDEPNRVDTVLDDCFRLISLFFLTIGRNREAPAIYSAAATVKKLLDHLKEAGFYLPQDLLAVRQCIKKWEDTLAKDPEDHSEHLHTLLQVRIDLCRFTLTELEAPLSRLEGRYMEIFEKLVSILRSLSSCNARSTFPTKEVKEFERQLLEIQKELNEKSDPHEGQSAEEVYAERLRMIQICENSVQPPETVVKSLLARCLLWVEIIVEKNGKIDPRFQDQFNKLRKIRNALNQMSLTQAWSLRETDLYDYNRQLDRIDEARVDGNFVDADGKPADLHSQRTLLYLLRKSYAFIFSYIIASEPVSEALLPIYNQLSTLKRCLIEVQKSGGVNSARELYPYSMKLNSINNMRKDGRFMVGEDIPEGQASVGVLLSECFDLAHQLKSEADERSEGSPKEVSNSIGVGKKD